MNIEIFSFTTLITHYHRCEPLSTDYSSFNLGLLLHLIQLEWGNVVIIYKLLWCFLYSFSYLSIIAGLFHPTSIIGKILPNSHLVSLDLTFDPLRCISPPCEQISYFGYYGFCKTLVMQDLAKIYSLHLHISISSWDAGNSRGFTIPVGVQTLWTVQ